MEKGLPILAMFLTLDKYKEKGAGKTGIDFNPLLISENGYPTSIKTKSTCQS